MKASIYRQLLSDPQSSAIALKLSDLLWGEAWEGVIPVGAVRDQGGELLSEKVLNYAITEAGDGAKMRVWDSTGEEAAAVVKPIGQSGMIGLDRSIELAQTNQLNESLKLSLRAAGIPPSRQLGDAGLAAAGTESLVRIHQYMQGLPQEYVADQLVDAIARFGDRMQVLCAQHHEACEAMCNFGGSEEIDRMVDQFEESIADVIKKLAIEVAHVGTDNEARSLKDLGWSVQFSRDPRGATVSIIKSKADVDASARASFFMGQQAFYFPPNRVRLAEDRALNLIPAQPNWKAISGYESEPSVPAADAKPDRATAPRAPKASKKKADEAPADFTKALDTDVMDILRMGDFDRDAGTYKLPGQLDRKTYERCAAALKLVGGKWKTGKQAFLFTESLSKFAEMLDTGRAVDKRDFDFFPTPPELADELASWLDLGPGMTVLEPQCGSLALAMAAARVVGKENVICYDILPEFVEKAREAGFTAHQADFFTLDPDQHVKVDRVIMNPPFASGSDIKHINHATQFLNKDGLLGAICSPHYKTASSNLATDFRSLVGSASDMVKDIEHGAFAESGTNVATVMLRLRADLIPWVVQAHEETERHEHQHIEQMEML